MEVGLWVFWRFLTWNHDFWRSKKSAATALWRFFFWVVLNLVGVSISHYGFFLYLCCQYYHNHKLIFVVPVDPDPHFVKRGIEELFSVVWVLEQRYLGLDFHRRLKAHRLFPLGRRNRREHARKDYRSSLRIYPLTPLHRFAYFLLTRLCRLAKFGKLYNGLHSANHMTTEILDILKSSLMFLSVLKPVQILPKSGL